jgi:hypothetical protein
MEVDRISQMGGVGREAVPAWTKSAQRRRRVTEEDGEPEHHDEDAAAEPSTEQELAAPEDPDRGLLDVMA